GLKNNALLDYTEAIELDEDFYEAVLGRGQVRLSLGQFGPAIGDLAHAIELAPENVEPYLALAEAALSVGDPDLAINTLGEGVNQIADQGDRLRLIRARAEAFVASHRFDEAMADWNEIVQAGTNDPAVYVARGETALEVGDFEAALADFE